MVTYAEAQRAYKNQAHAYIRTCIALSAYTTRQFVSLKYASETAENISNS